MSLVYRSASRKVLAGGRHYMECLPIHLIANTYLQFVKPPEYVLLGDYQASVAIDTIALT